MSTEPKWRSGLRPLEHGGISVTELKEIAKEVATRIGAEFITIEVFYPYEGSVATDNID